MTAGPSNIAPPSNRSPKRPARWPRRLLSWAIHLALLVGACVLAFSGVETLRTQNAGSELDREIAAARARGEPVWFSDLQPAATDPAENASSLLLAAKKQLVAGDQEFWEAMGRIPGQMRKGDAAWKDDLPLVRKYVDENRAGLDAVHEALHQPFGRAPLNYDDPFAHLTALLDYCQAARAAARFLQADFVVAIADDDVERATAATDDCLAAAALTCNEPAFTAHMSGIAVAGIAQWKLEVLLANARLTSDQYRRLDRRLKEMSDSYRMRDAILAERAYQLTVFKMVKDLGENILDMPHFPEKQPTSSRIMGPSRDEELLFLFRYFTEMASVIDGTGTTGEARWQAFAAASRRPERHRYTKHASSSHLALRNTGMRHRQWLLNARLGLRVDRYYRQNGRLPPTLKEALDEKMPELPVCLYSELPPILAQRGAEGFVVYVPGSNGRDDGADQAIDAFEARSAFKVIYKPEQAKP